MGQNLPIYIIENQYSLHQKLPALPRKCVAFKWPLVIEIFNNRSSSTTCRQFFGANVTDAENTSDGSVKRIEFTSLIDEMVNNFLLLDNLLFIVHFVICIIIMTH